MLWRILVASDPVNFKDFIGRQPGVRERAIRRHNLCVMSTGRQEFKRKTVIRRCRRCGKGFFDFFIVRC
jgi:hypothetical protein